MTVSAESFKTGMRSCPFAVFKVYITVLRSVVFLLVITSIITTPTRAYEANANLLVQKQLITKEQEFFTNFHLKTEFDAALNISYGNGLVCAFNNQTQKTLPVLKRRENARDFESLDVCAKAALRAEKTYQIKEGLLQTIASVESGRWDKATQKRISWPWAVQVNGKGHYYGSKDEAVAAVKALIAEGINNIDVGCMQINLKYHGDAFSSVEEAFEPEKNVAYSARFLKNLYQHNGHSWQKTAMQYHSKNHARGAIYKSKLEQHFAAYIAEFDYQTLF